MFIKKALAGVAILLLAACGDKITVNSNFSRTADIEKGQEVFFNDQVIGEVTGVDNQDTQTRVTIELEGKNLEQVDSSAAVVINRLKQGAPLEIYNRNTKTGAVKDGQELKGLNSMFELGAWMVGDAINIGGGTLSGYVAEFQKYLDSDQFEQDKTQVQQQIQQAGEAAKEAIKAVNNDMNKAVEELSDSESEAAKAVEQLGKELAPVVAELGKSGAEIMQELDKLSENLEQKTESNQELGANFLQSLLVMLQQLNEGLNAGQQTGQETEKQAEENTNQE